MEGVAGARWQTDEQLHCTLAFLGEVDGHLAADIDLALSRVRGAPIPLSLTGAGMFGQASKPNSLWLGIAREAALLQLHRSVQHALTMAGASPERRAFAPHLTVARLNRGSGPVEPWVARHAGLTTQLHLVDCFFLYESHLGSSGAIYEPVGRYMLA